MLCVTENKLAKLALVLWLTELEREFSAFVKTTALQHLQNNGQSQYEGNSELS